MTAPPHFSLDLAELARPWTPAVAPPSEAVQPFIVSSSASAIPEFGVYEDAASSPFTYFGHVHSAGPPRSRFLILAAIASISAVAFLVLRCFALLTAESSLRISGSFSRRLSDDDDVFTCPVPGGEAGESAAVLEGEDEGASGGVGIISSIHPTVIQQLEALELMRAEAQRLTTEEVHAVASAQASMRSLISRLEYLEQRIDELSLRLRGLQRQEEIEGEKEEGEEDEDDEEEGASSGSAMLVVKQELELETKELDTIKERLHRMKYTSQQDVQALLYRAHHFSQGRYISGRASRALAAQRVVLGTEASLPSQVTNDSMVRTRLLVTDLLLQSSTCRNELQRLQQQASLSGQSRATAAAISAPIAHSGRLLLSDLKETANQLRRAGMQGQAKEVQCEAERMTRLLDAGGFLSSRGSPRANKRLFGAEASLTVDWVHRPLQLWSPGTAPRSPWQRYPSAEIFLSSEQSPDESSSSDVSEQLAADLQSKPTLESSSRSVEDTRTPPRQATPPVRGPSASSWAAPLTGGWKRLWRSSPEIFTTIIGAPSAESQPQESTGVPSSTLWSRGAAGTTAAAEEDSDDSSDASSEQLLEMFWLTGEGTADAKHWRPSEERRRTKEAESYARKGLKLLQGWIERAKKLLEEDATNYATFDKLKYHMKDGESIVSAWNPAKGDAVSPLLSKATVQEIRYRLTELETLLLQVQERIVQRALNILSASETNVSDSMVSLQQAIAMAPTSDLNRILFSNVLMGVADTIVKTQAAHSTYARLALEMPAASDQLRTALVSLAEKSFDAAVLLVHASDQVPPRETDGAEEESGAHPQEPLGARPASQPAPPKDASDAQGAAASAAYPPRSAESSETSRDDEVRELLSQDPDGSGAPLINAAAQKASDVLNKLKLQ